MNLKDLPDWHDVVAANWKKTTGFILAREPQCLKVRDEELAAVRENRVLIGLSWSELDGWTPPASWILAVLVCPGDSVNELAAWAHRQKADPARIHFYVHEGADEYTALGSWAQVGLPDPAVDTGMTSWTEFHKKFGLDLAIRILQDWG